MPGLGFCYVGKVNDCSPSEGGDRHLGILMKFRHFALSILMWGVPQIFWSKVSLRNFAEDWRLVGKGGKSQC